MADTLVRDIPPETVDVLKAEAARQNRSLNDVAREALVTYAELFRRRAVLDRAAEEFEQQARASGPPEPGRALREYDEAMAALDTDLVVHEGQAGA